MATVGRLRVAFGTREALVDAEIEFAKLGRPEADGDTVGIGEIEIEMVVRSGVGVARGTAARAHGFERRRAGL